MNDFERLDDILIDLELPEEKPSDAAPPAPLEFKPIVKPKPQIRPTTNYKQSVELNQHADRLFDFSATNLTPVQQMYIIGYATRGTRRGACEMACVTYNVVSKWEKSEEFNQALQNAVDMVRDSLEEELFRRAMNGSDKLLIEAIKAHNPEKYNKKQADVNISGTLVHSFADLAKQATQLQTAEPEPIDVESVSS